jgi:uncharacterized protein YbgA (DUF1722 family)
MTALEKPATRRRHVSVLRRIARLVRPPLESDERAELASAIEGFERGLVPLLVPLTLLRHHARRHRVPSLAGQVYLEPDPRELQLRNHV